MAASTAVNGYGSDFAIGNAADGSSTAWTSVAEVTSISDPEFSVTDIDVSNLASPGAYKEHIPGMVDPGQSDLTLNYTKANKAQLLALLRVKKDIRITFSDASGITTTTAGSKLVVPAFLLKLGGDIPTDNKISSKATFKLAGQPTFTAGS